MSTSLYYYIMYVCVYIILVWAIHLPFRSGLLYNGSIYCMAIGGFFAAYAVKTLGWPFPLALLAAVVLGAVFGFFPALGFSRTSGVVTAIASSSLIFIVRSVIQNLDFLGGAAGLLALPKIDGLLYIGVGSVVVLGILIFRLSNSRLGRAFEAVGTDEDMAESLGINVRWLKIAGLTISSCLGAIAGVLFAFTSRAIQASSCTFTMLLTCMSMMYVGGRYTMWGALVSVPVLWGLPQWLPNSMADFNKIIYGALMILVLATRPEGLVSRKMTRTAGNFLKKYLAPGRIGDKYKNSETGGTDK